MVHRLKIHTEKHDPSKTTDNDVTGALAKAVKDGANDLHRQLGGLDLTP